MNKLLYWFTLIFSVVCLSNAPPVQAVPLVASSSVALDQKNYSDSGLNIGNSGFWFANFNAPAQVANRPVDDNDRNFLPTWIKVDFDPNSTGYSFALPTTNTNSTAFSTGGQQGYNILTLPYGEQGRSGQLVDVGVDPLLRGGQSDTIITRFVFGPGAPNSFLLHIVLDNDPSDSGNHVSRLRVKHFSADGNQSGQAQFDNLTSDSEADVYSFLFDNVQEGNYFTVQLRTTDGPNTGMAGLMFDVIPEPSSLLLMALGAAGMGWIMARRGGKRGHGSAY